MDGKVWLVISRSCDGCNCLDCTVFNHKPSKDDIKFTRNKLNGLFYGEDLCFECEINGKSTFIEIGKE